MVYREAVNAIGHARSTRETPNPSLQVVKDLTNLTPTTAWTAIDTLATQNLAGQTVRVRITTTNDVVNPTSFYFDTLALTATICQ